MQGRASLVRFSFIPGIVACAVLLFAPASAWPKSGAAAKALITVAADVNPDSGGRASPIVVRLYQLKEQGAFAASDFFAIYDKEAATLGGGLIGREEYVFNPGEQRELELKLDKDAKFLGVVAAYRDIGNSKWRALTAAPKKNLIDLIHKDKLTLNVARAEITIVIGKPKKK
jgi:type VI secretion system protein VasD